MSRRKWIPREEWKKLYDHPKWQEKRLEILNYAEFQCQLCGNKEEKLDVHHCRYRQGKKPWEYPNGWLVCLCRTCHEKHHGKSLAETPPPKEEEVIQAAIPVSPSPEFEQLKCLVIARRKLIRQWVESLSFGYIHDGGMVLYYSAKNEFAALFLKQGHSDFLNQCVSEVLGRSSSLEIFHESTPLAEMPDGETRLQIKIGSITDMLGKL